MPIRISGSTGISGLDGSATTPAIQGASANSGIYYSGNTVFVSTSGINALTIGPTGNVAFTNTNVSIGGQALSSATGMRNRIINGDMRIDQRNGGGGVVYGTNAYAVDRFTVFKDVAGGNVSCQQTTTAPPNFNNSLYVTVNSTFSSTSLDGFIVRHTIEGFNFADLAWGTSSAKSVTLSFWVRSSVTGTFSGSIVNGSAFNYSYPYTYTINAANTWEYKSITIPGPTAGTWIGNTNGMAARIYWELGSGSDFRGASGSWVGTGILGVTGSVSLAETLNSNFYLTGVQLEEGSVATPFDRRSYGQELALCQRYFYNLSVSSEAEPIYCYSGLNLHCFFPVTMRSVPTVTVTSGSATVNRTRRSSVTFNPYTGDIAYTAAIEL
jgi:hypothetical protein